LSTSILLPKAFNSFDLGAQFASNRDQFRPMLAQFGSQEILYHLANGSYYVIHLLLRAPVKTGKVQ
jgi:hypothetical protein